MSKPTYLPKANIDTSALLLAEAVVIPIAGIVPEPSASAISTVNSVPEPACPDMYTGFPAAIVEPLSFLPVTIIAPVTSPITSPVTVLKVTLSVVPTSWPMLIFPAEYVTPVPPTKCASTSVGISVAIHVPLEALYLIISPEEEPVRSIS